MSAIEDGILEEGDGRDDPYAPEAHDKTCACERCMGPSPFERKPYPTLAPEAKPLPLGHEFVPWEDGGTYCAVVTESGPGWSEHCGQPESAHR